MMKIRIYIPYIVYASFYLLQVLSEETSGGRIKFKTIKSEETKSILLINDADLLDSGKYSCYPSNTEIASLRVHVLQGTYPKR